MTYTINPESEGAWSLKASIAKQAVKTADNRTFIPPFTLGSNFTSRFLAVGVKVNASYSTWKYGGYIGQEFGFTSSGYTVDDKAHWRTKDLLLNTINIIELPLITTSPFTLRFFPPNWFFDVEVEVWEYTGEIDNGCNNSLNEDTEKNILDILDNVLALISLLGDIATGDIVSILAKLDDVLALVGNNNPPPPVLPPAVIGGEFVSAVEGDSIIFAYTHGYL